MNSYDTMNSYDRGYIYSCVQVRIHGHMNSYRYMNSYYNCSYNLSTDIWIHINVWIYIMSVHTTLLQNSQRTYVFLCPYYTNLFAHVKTWARFHMYIWITMSHVINSLIITLNLLILIKFSQLHPTTSMRNWVCPHKSYCRAGRWMWRLLILSTKRLWLSSENGMGMSSPVPG